MDTAFVIKSALGVFIYLLCGFYIAELLRMQWLKADNDYYRNVSWERMQKHRVIYFFLWLPLGIYHLVQLSQNTANRKMDELASKIFRQKIANCAAHLVRYVDSIPSDKPATSRVLTTALLSSLPNDILDIMDYENWEEIQDLAIKIIQQEHGRIVIRTPTGRKTRIKNKQNIPLDLSIEDWTITRPRPE